MKAVLAICVAWMAAVPALAEAEALHALRSRARKASGPDSCGAIDLLKSDFATHI